MIKSSFITFQKVCKYNGIPRDDWKLNGQYNYIEFTNGSRIDLLDCDYKPSDPNYERFGSLEYTGGWIEEAGEIKFGAFDVLKSRISRHLNKEFNLPPKMLITCNPNKDWLYRLIYRPHRKHELAKEYAFIQSLYNDNPHTAVEYGKMLSQIRDKATKQRLMFGNWEYDDDPNALIEYDAIVDMFTNTAEHSNDKYLTADIARFGKAKTVIMLWKGLEVYKVVTRQQQGLDETAIEIRTLLANERIPHSHAIVDEDGVGGGVKDMLQGIKGFVSNSSPIDTKANKENYRNLKAQCGYMLADAINARKIAIRVAPVATGIEGYTQKAMMPSGLKEDIKDAIIEELEQLKAKEIERDAKLQLTPKEDVIENIGRSPDYSDTMLMRMYFELSPKESEVEAYRPVYKGYGKRV